MKKCQLLLGSQHKGFFNHVYNNNTPTLSKKPINKCANYELLLKDFYDENPNPSNAELSQACLYFAKQCGLKISPIVKAKVRAQGGLYVD